MGIIIHTDGRFEASSVEEALELHRRIVRMHEERSSHSFKDTSPTEIGTLTAKGKPPKTGGKPNPDLVTWHDTLSPLQQTVVARLRTERRIPRADLVQMVESGGRSFVRFMETLKESIEAAGMKTSDIYLREMEGFGADKRTFYAVGRKLMNSAL